MDIDESAPGNISQQGGTSSTDNETGHDPKRSDVPSKTAEVDAPNNPKQDPAAKKTRTVPTSNQNLNISRCKRPMLILRGVSNISRIST
jgi:hypothetical protein